jgi:hypothetical protein
LVTGKIAPGDATPLMSPLSARTRVVEVDDLEKCIIKMQQAHGD